MKNMDSYKTTDADEIFHARDRTGIIVGLYKDSTSIPDGFTASVLHNQASLNEQMNTGIFNLIKPDQIYAFSSENDACTGNAFYCGSWWYEGYCPDDICQEYGIKPLYKRFLWVVSINTTDGVPYAQAARLDTHQAINLQLEEQHLTNAYLCKSKAEAERLRKIINAMSHQ